MARSNLLLDVTIGSFAGFHIDVEELNELIEEHGICVEWRQAVRCPCVRVETLRPRIGCLACNGIGYTHPESMRRPLVIFMLNRQPSRKIIQVGEYVTGQVTVTFPAPFVPGEGDLLVPDNEVHIVHETLVRASQQIDNKRLMGERTHTDQAPPKMRPPEERLRYPDLIKVDSVHWIGENGQLCKAGSMDVEIVGNLVRWKRGRGPEPGNAYTVRYQAPAMYQLQPSEPVARIEGSSVFPYRAIGYRLDKIGEPDQR